jgi:hypothetical protein
VGARLDRIAAIDGQQPGDPVRGAQIFVDLGTMDKPPAQLVLGTGLLNAYRERLRDIEARLCEWESISTAADYTE